MIRMNGMSIDVKRFQCTNMQCTWFRDYLTGKAAEIKFYHKEYGVVTHAVAAQRDIAHHDCHKHFQAVQRVRALHDVAKEYRYVNA